MKTYRKNKFNEKNAKHTKDEVKLTDKYFFILLGVLILIGFILRIHKVGELSLWVDEYVHVSRVQDYLKGVGKIWIGDKNGILYTYLLIPIFYLLHDNEFWARFLSVLFGTVSIYLTFLLGKRLFNRYVGFLSAFLFTFSLYGIYWSRVARNYTIFTFFYLLLLYLFLKWFENKEKIKGTYFERNGINLKLLPWLLVVFLLSTLSHQSTFFLVFSLAVYFILNEIVCGFSSNRDTFRNKYFLLSVFSFLFLAFLFTPFLSQYFKDILGLLLNEKMVNWVIPNWEDLKTFYRETPFKIFNRYYGVLLYDLRWLNYVGILGLIISFIKKKKSGIFIFSMFAVVFLLMSFIFYNPSLPRYLLFIYPLFLIVVAYGLYFIVNSVVNVTQHNISLGMVKLLWILPLVLISLFMRWDEIGSLIKVEKDSGLIVDRSLSEWSFTNWKYPCRYVKNYMREGDVVLSTVPNATNYYLEQDISVRFRQRHYDSVQKKYVNNDFEDTSEPNAYSLENLERTLQNNDRGWLIADYYFYNVLTDPRARLYVCQHMDFHPAGTRDGEVLVFSWDKKNPKRKSYQTMLYVLGKSESKVSTQELNMKLRKEIEKVKNPILYVMARTVSKNEMIVLINKKHQVVMPPTKTDKIERLEVKLNPGILKGGNNKFKVFYNKKVKLDNVKGFSIHHMGIVVR